MTHRELLKMLSRLFPSVFKPAAVMRDSLGDFLAFKGVQQRGVAEERVYSDQK